MGTCGSNRSVIVARVDRKLGKSFGRRQTGRTPRDKPVAVDQRMQIVEFQTKASPRRVMPQLQNNNTQLTAGPSITHSPSGRSRKSDTVVNLDAMGTRRPKSISEDVGVEAEDSAGPVTQTQIISTLGLLIQCGQQ